MAITIRKMDDRDVYELTYDNFTGEGTVEAKFHNQANGDKSSKIAVDDGTLTISCAKGWSGTDDVKVIHNGSGDTLDEGEVTFG